MRAMVLGSSDVILPEDLPEAVLETEAPGHAQITRYQDAINDTKRRLIVDAFAQAGANYTQAARALGVPTPTIFTG